MKRIVLACLAAALACLTLWSTAPAEDPKPSGSVVKLLVITGDHGHDWKATTAYFKDFLPKDRIAVDVTETPGKDLTPDNLKKYDVLLLNYKDTAKGATESPDSVWSPENKQAFLGAVRSGKGLVVYHHTSSAFLEWLEFERCIAGGWRGQGYHGPKHQFTVKMTAVEHPITKGLPKSFVHEVDELYANSVMFPENVVLATAYSDPNKEYGTGLDEAMIWVKRYGRGRVFVNAMGHDVAAMKGVGFQTLMIRGIEWAASGNVTYPVPAGLAALPAAKPASIGGWGDIRGRVVFAGDEIPQPTLLVRQGDPNVKDANVCAAQKIFSEDLVVNRVNRAIRWAVVYLAGRPSIHPDIAKATGDVELSIEGCRFTPHVLALRAGQSLKLSNADPVAHNFKLDGFKNNSFNAIVRPAQAGQKSELTAPALVAETRPIQVSNNIHPWMRAYLAVFDHPYFAVIDEDGGFEIKNAPAGMARLVVWQEKLGFGEGRGAGKEIEIIAGQTTDLGELKLMP